MIDLNNILKEKFGFLNFKPGQKETIEAIINNNSAIAILPTGGGKTLIYQMINVLQKNGLIIIITPLISLMQDQVARLNYLGEKKVVALNSFLSSQEKKKIIQNLKNYNLIYISPEMLNNKKIIDKFKSIKINLLVIDEAHLINEWGSNFRPMYLNLPKIHIILKKPQLLILTATIKKEDLNYIKRIFTLKEKQKWIIYKSKINRKNIHLRTEQFLNEKEKRKRLVKLVKYLQIPAIIYVNSRKKANELAYYLSNITKYNIAAYHAGMNYMDRYSIQQKFMNNKTDIIISTSAFGMGIDKNNIRYIIHYNISKSISNYIQEIGRAGRDNKESIAILLYSKGDEYIPNKMLEESNNSITELINNKAIIDLIKHYNKNKFNEFNELLEYSQSKNKLREKLFGIFDNEQYNEENESSNLNEYILKKFKKNIETNEKIKKEPEKWKAIINQLFNL